METAELTNILSDLRSSDSAARLKASKKLESELRKAANKQRQELFGKAEVTSALIAALDDAGPKIVHNAVVALSQISRHYFQDDAAYSKIVPLFHSTHPLTTRWSIDAAIHLRGEASLDDILPMTESTFQEARALSLYHFYVWLVQQKNAEKEPVAAASREKLRSTALRALNDEDATVRGNAADLLSEVGDGEDLTILKSKRKSETHWLAKQTMERTIKAIEDR